MPTWNLRNIPEDLAWKAKKEAVNRRMTLQDFVISIVREAINEHIEQQTKEQPGASDVSLRQTELPEPRKARYVEPTERSNRVSETGHDSTTCRVYKCGLCAAIKAK
jgi:hypothetical protein